ncbi:hypothetical protein Ancab_007060 [Ancistrocladus abbreviatus]
MIPNANSIPISRRCAVLISVIPLSLIALPLTSEARERRSKKTIPLEDYLSSPDGLKYYDVVEGKGPVAEKGSTVQVHFDCVYRGITAVSSRESKLLAGNRIIAQPYEFKVGSIPGKERKREYVDNPNGLFSAQAAPKPPPAMYSITEGMRVGGKRTVIVPPEAGYGKKGMNEIPPEATFDLNIELLEVLPAEEKSTAAYLIISIALLLTPVLSDLILPKVDRRLLFTAFSGMVSGAQASLMPCETVENEGSDSVSSFLLAFTDHQAANLAFLSVLHSEGKGKSSGPTFSLPVELIHPGGMPPALTFYFASLPKHLGKGESVTLEVLAD